MGLRLKYKARPLESTTTFTADGSRQSSSVRNGVARVAITLPGASCFSVSGSAAGAGDRPARAQTIYVTTPHERALALALLQFSEALERVAADYRPNFLTGYLFELASRYSDFFEHCPVLKAESDELRTSRLQLCDLTARTLERGLNLLGIEVVERM